MKLTLPFPPSVNGYWRSTSRGTLISEGGRKYRVNVIAAVFQQLRRRPQAITHDIDIHVVLYPQNRAKRELDNFQKSLTEAVTHAVAWGHEIQIKRILVECVELLPKGQALVIINPYL